MTFKYEEGSNLAYAIFEKAFIECSEQLTMNHGYDEAIAMGIMASTLQGIIANIFTLCHDPYSMLDNHVISINKRITDIINEENEEIEAANET